MADRDAMRQRTVVLTKLGMDQVRTRRELLYSISDTLELCADLYTPPRPQPSIGLRHLVIKSGLWHKDGDR